MITGISGAQAVTPASTAQQTAATASVAQTAAVKATSGGSTQSASSPNAQGDSVHISKSAQARMLKRQGHTVADIATRLKVDNKTAASYLK